MGLARLLVLASLMLGSTLLASYLPQFCRFSPRRLEQVSTYSTGLLIGAALTIVIPEGVAAVYTNSRPEGHERGHEHGHDAHSNPSSIGIALLSGFILMYIIDSIHSHEPPRMQDRRSPVSRNSRATLHRLPSAVSELEPLADHHPYHDRRSDDSHDWSEPAHGSRSSSPFHGTNEGGLPLPATDRKSIPLSSSASAPGSGVSTPTRGGTPISSASALSTVIGLLVHSLADGVSLGASSLSSGGSANSLLRRGASEAPTGGTSLELIIFLAIMVHKAPAAFALSSLLSGAAVSPWFLRRSLLAFSFAAPLGALATFGFLTLVGAESGGDVGWWTGLALVFSGGTFLFVATHVMKGQEDSSHGSDGGGNEGEERSGKRKRMGLVILGMVTPLVLSQIVGHGH